MRNLLYQYGVFPFDLSTAPRVFSKVLTVAAAHLCRQDMITFPYLDDCLLKAPAYQEAVDTTHTTITLFTNLGLQINLQKSTLTPAQQLDFIGAHLECITATNGFLP